MTASFYGWLPLYLPELFRTNVRATGQGFGFNFGRILAAIGVLQIGNLMSLFNDGRWICGFLRFRRLSAGLLDDEPDLSGRHGASSGSPRKRAASRCRNELTWRSRLSASDEL